MGENQGNDVENHSQKPKSGEDGQGPKGHEETSETMNRIEAKLDLQQFARLEVEIAAGRLREEMERHVGKLRKDAEGHKREIKSQNWKGVLAILGALGLLGVGGWYAAWDYLQDRTEEAIDQGAKAIQARLDEEFQTPRIQKLMADTVTKESARLLRENVVPEVEKLREDADALLAGVRSDTTARMAEFGHFVDGLQERPEAPGLEDGRAGPGYRAPTEKEPNRLPWRRCDHAGGSPCVRHYCEDQPVARGIFRDKDGRQRAGVPRKRLVPFRQSDRERHAGSDGRGNAERGISVFALRVHGGLGGEGPRLEASGEGRAASFWT
jgi:hypothetical protein